MQVIPKHIFIISTFVYVIINLIENTIHYNIGRNFDIKHFHDIVYVPPSSLDFVRIVLVMAIFAILQGIFTVMLANRFA
jgi:hypothetical protein